MLLTKLVADGKVTRGYLGVVIGDLDNELAKSLQKKRRCFNFRYLSPWNSSC